MSNSKDMLASTTLSPSCFSALTSFSERPVEIVTMKSAIFASLVATAAAFAPASNKASTALKASAFENELGVISPTGFWDPCGLSENIDQATFDQYRAAELKHGRVAMLCVLGYVAPETFRWGGELAFGLKFADVPNGVAALSAVPFAGWLQMFALIGLVEYNGFLGDFDVS